MEPLTLILAADAGTPDTENRCWVEVLVTTNGEVVQNHGSFVLDRTDLETCATQIRDNPDKLPLDYDHSYVEGGSTVASGWFTGQASVLAKGDERPNGTTASEDELWAEVEWTPQAADDIRSKRFRFISAEFRFAEVAKGVKKRVVAFFAATLTNRPFFNRMEAVTLSRATTTAVVWDTTAGYQTIRDRLSAALNPPAPGEEMSCRYWICDIDIAGLKALVEDSQEATTYVVPFTLDDQGEPMVSDRTQWVEAEQQWVAAAKTAAASYTGREATTERDEMDTTVLKKSLGLADSATDDDVAEALSAAVEKASQVDGLAAELETLKGDKTELDTLREELKVEKTKRIAGERTQIFADAIGEGRMAPSEEEALVDAFGENVEALRKVLDARPKNATLAREKGSGGGGNDDDVETTVEAKKFKSDDPIDEESLSEHKRTLQILGKDSGYTEDEYLAAAEKARRGETVTA